MDFCLNIGSSGRTTSYLGKHSWGWFDPFFSLVCILQTPVILAKPH
jgi:hypothetical protein